MFLNLNVVLLLKVVARTVLVVGLFNSLGLNFSGAGVKEASDALLEDENDSSLLFLPIFIVNTNAI